MAQQLNSEQAGWVLVRIWLTAFEKTARDYHGPRPKKFCMRAYEHATEEYLNVLQEDHGIVAKKAKSIREAVENYIDVGVKGGLFKDPSQFEIVETNPNSIEIKVLSCRYLKTCKDLLDGGLGLKDLTCARVGCFRAAAMLLANIDCTYQVLSVDLVHGCHGIVERI
jgi:hypothetical protein